MAAALAVALTVGSSAHADFEVVAQTVGAYGNPPLCCPTCDNLREANTDGIAFINALEPIFDTAARKTNSQVLATNFMDETTSIVSNGVVLATGQDNVSPNGTDWADVIFYAGHGGSANDHLGKRYSSIPMGSPVASPVNMWAIDVMGLNRGNMRLGGTTAARDANAFILLACQTLQYQIWKEDGFDRISAADGQFNIVNAFHGNFEEVHGYRDELKAYAEGATWNGIGDAFLDRMFDPDGDEDTCPMSVVYGANNAETDDFYTNAGWLDFHNTGARNTAGLPRLHYICGCNPDSGEQLPSC